MEAVALGLAVATAFKEVLLIARFVSGALSTDAKEELLDIHSEFQHEVLFLHTLHKLFLDNQFLVQDPELNEQWLRHVQNILGKLQKVSSEYSRLAAKHDPAYQQYLVAVTSGQKAEGSSFQDTQPQPVQLSIFSNLVDPSPLSRSQTFKWALSDRQKITETVRKYRKWNARLKDLMFIAVSVVPRYFNMDQKGLQDIQNDTESQIAGLGSAAGLRLSVIAPPSRDVLVQLKIALSLLDMVHKAGSITRAVIRKPNPGGFSILSQVIVEYKPYLLNPNDPQELRTITSLEQNIAHLAAVLSSVEWTTFSSLSCCGYFHDPPNKRFGLVLELPPRASDCSPVSLDDCLRNASDAPPPSLDARFEMGLCIAKSLEAFHAIGWVHKSIRSGSIIFLIKDSKQREEAFNHPFLTGFEFSRTVSGPTDYTYDDDIQRNIYRHPARQGPPQTSFNKIHDIYALGVILLEIGLWKSVITLYQRKASELAKLGSGREYNAVERRSWLTSRAEKYLPHSMGKKYKDVVVLCLSGNFRSKVEEPAFAMEFHDRIIGAIQSIKIN